MKRILILLSLVSAVMVTGCAKPQIVRIMPQEDLSRVAIEEIIEDKDLTAEEKAVLVQMKMSEDIERKKRAVEMEKDNKLSNIINRPVTPLRTPDTILRVLILPYEDSNGVLNGWKYSYVKVDDGKWIMADYLNNSVTSTKMTLTPLQTEGSDNIGSIGMAPPISNSDIKYTVKAVEENTKEELKQLKKEKKVAEKARKQAEKEKARQAKLAEKEQAEKEKALLKSAEKKDEKAVVMDKKDTDKMQDNSDKSAIEEKNNDEEKTKSETPIGTIIVLDEAEDKENNTHSKVMDIKKVNDKQVNDNENKPLKKPLKETGDSKSNDKADDNILQDEPSDESAVNKNKTDKKKEEGSKLEEKQSENTDKKSVVTDKNKEINKNTETKNKEKLSDVKEDEAYSSVDGKNMSDDKINKNDTDKPASNIAPSETSNNKQADEKNISDDVKDDNKGQTQIQAPVLDKNSAKSANNSIPADIKYDTDNKNYIDNQSDNCSTDLIREERPLIFKF